MPKLDELLQRIPGREGWRRIDEPVKELKPFQNANTQKVTNEPTGRYFVTIAGPTGVTQRMILGEGEGADDWTFEGLDAVHAVPKDASSSSTAISGSQYGSWEPDPANPGKYRQVVEPQAGISNPDENRSKALKAQTDEADRDRRIANERATGMYVDDKTLSDIRHAEATDRVAADRLKEDIRNNTANQKLADDKLHLENQKLLLDIARSPYDIAKIGSETDLNKAQMVALGIKTAADADRAVKAGLLDDAQAAKIKAELLKPEPVTTTTDQPFIASRDPNGQLVFDPNQNYQGPKAPTTRGELAQRVALLQSQAMQMKDKIQADKSIPPDQQAARFATWYDQNVAPQAGALEQQQQAIIQDENLKAIEQQRTNLASASSAMSGLMPYRVGPGYGQAFEKIVQDTANTKFAGAPNQAPLDLGTGWSTFKAPNLDEHIKNLVSSQTTPAPGMDIRGMLDQNQWTPGGAPPPAGGPPAPGAPPSGQVPQHPLYPGLAQGTGPVPPGQSSYTIPGLNPSMMPGGQGLADFRASLPPPAVMPMATGNEPLPYAQPYNPFRNVLPALPGYAPNPAQNPYQWPFGGGGGGNSGFTAGP